MKKHYSISGLLQFLIIASSLLFSATANSQDMPEAQRMERCQNNKNRIAALQTESEKIRIKLLDYWTEEKMAKTKKQAQFVRRFIDQKDKRRYQEQLNEVMKISVENEFKFGSCVERNIKQKDPKSECAKYLLTHINSKIHVEENVVQYKQQWLQQKSDLDRQIAQHKTNLIALNCDAGSTAGSLLGTWSGTYHNSKNKKGTSTISFTKGTDGKITGIEDGAPINDVTVSGNVIRWKYKTGSCRTFEGSLIINADGKTATGSYTATGCNDEYSGKYIDYKKH